MANLQINDLSIPSLKGQVAVITGGSSGIGFAAAKILITRGAKVLILDVHPPPDVYPTKLFWIRCNVTVWQELSSVFRMIGRTDMVFANAGISETEPFLLDEVPVDKQGLPLEPTYPILDVNLKSFLNVIKLSWSIMKKQEEGGRIVLTASSTAYAPEVGIPLDSALKSALVGLVRSLRPMFLHTNITINAVAPGVTETPMMPQKYLDLIRAACLPVSTADFVGLALVYLATAQVYQKDDSERSRPWRWNGNVILTLGNRYTELEGPLEKSRPGWLGPENDQLIKAQQALGMGSVGM